MNRSSVPSAPAPDGDPWAAFGYLVAGVAFYGALGWGLSVWLHHDYWIPIGLLVGLGFGMYLVFTRYRIGGPNAPIIGSDPKVKINKTPDPAIDPAPPVDPQIPPIDLQIPPVDPQTDSDDAARVTRPDDDRGETA